MECLIVCEREREQETQETECLLTYSSLSPPPSYQWRKHLWHLSGICRLGASERSSDVAALFKLPALLLIPLPPGSPCDFLAWTAIGLIHATSAQLGWKAGMDISEAAGWCSRSLESWCCGEEWTGFCMRLSPANSEVPSAARPPSAIQQAPQRSPAFSSRVLASLFTCLQAVPAWSRLPNMEVTPTCEYNTHSSQIQIQHSRLAAIIRDCWRTRLKENNGNERAQGWKHVRIISWTWTDGTGWGCGSCTGRLQAL